MTEVPVRIVAAPALEERVESIVTASFTQVTQEVDILCVDVGDSTLDIHPSSRFYGSSWRINRVMNTIDKYDGQD